MDTAQPTTLFCYDTLATFRRLTASGMPEAQAEAVTYEKVYQSQRDLAIEERFESLQNELAALKTMLEAVQADTRALRTERH